MRLDELEEDGSASPFLIFEAPRTSRFVAMTYYLKGLCYGDLPQTSLLQRPPVLQRHRRRQPR